MLYFCHCETKGRSSPVSVNNHLLTPLFNPHGITSLRPAPHEELGFTRNDNEKLFISTPQHPFLIFKLLTNKQLH